jgi:hypothetical protein
MPYDNNDFWNGPVFIKSRKQSAVRDSAPMAECLEAHQVARNAVFLREVLNELNCI